jgi:N utilization substance protein A
VPEIYNGTVEIKAIAREAGSRSKVAVAALQEGVDPVGSCVGIRGMRIQSIVNELGGEKIDVVEWNPDTSVFIGNALSPARVKYAVLGETGTNSKTATVIVPDDQLSLAIGKEGQNARLAAKLTGWRIDIKSTSEAADEVLRPKGTLAAAPAKDKERDILAMAEAILLGKAAPEPAAPLEPATVESESAGLELEQEAASEEAEPAVTLESEQDDATLMEAEELLAQSATVKETAAQETAAQETAAQEPTVQDQAPAELAMAEEIEAEIALVEQAEAEIETPVAESKELQVAEAEAVPEMEAESAPEGIAQPASEPEPLGVLRRKPEPEPKRVRKPKYEYVKDEQLEALEQPKKQSRRRRRRQLVLDEETGQMVSRPRHKREEDTGEWSGKEY